jgi:hypothetical protein
MEDLSKCRINAKDFVAQLQEMVWLRKKPDQYLWFAHFVKALVFIFMKE